MACRRARILSTVASNVCYTNLQQHRHQHVCRSSSSKSRNRQLSSVLQLALGNCLGFVDATSDGILLCFVSFLAQSRALRGIPRSDWQPVSGVSPHRLLVYMASLVSVPGRKAPLVPSPGRTLNPRAEYMLTSQSYGSRRSRISNGLMTGRSTTKSNLNDNDAMCFTPVGRT